jgi:hypothetical protein
VLLNPSKQFFGHAFDPLELVVRYLGSLLFKLALSDVPVAFDFECGHNWMISISNVHSYGLLKSFCGMAKSSTEQQNYNDNDEQEAGTAAPDPDRTGKHGWE